VESQRPGPLVIGGLGGSGTRAVARTVEHLGVSLGSVLNRSHDNLWFTLLCKQPGWLDERAAAERPDLEIVARLQLLEAMLWGAPLTAVQLQLLSAAAAHMATYGHDARGSLSGHHGFQIVADFMRDQEAPAAGSAAWGFKEPNSHLVLEEMVAVWPRMTYVHVVRHPLDMAWSDNTTQTLLWGHLAGVRVKDLGDPTEMANAQLAWWLASTGRVERIGKVLGERFVLLNYDRFCVDPQPWTAHIAAVSGIEADTSVIARACEHVHRPESAGRWRQRGLDVLDPNLIAAASQCGFELPE
jgi:hypothetical protein